MKRPGWPATCSSKFLLRTTHGCRTTSRSRVRVTSNVYSRKTVRRIVQSCGYDVVAQMVTNPSSRVYKHNYGWNGLVKHFVKGTMLRVLPNLALGLWTYHSALLYRKGE